MKFVEIVAAQQVLHMLCQKSSPLGYENAKNSVIANKASEALYDLRKSINEQYAEKGEDGKAKLDIKKTESGQEYQEYVIDAEKKVDYDAAMVAFMEDDSHEVKFHKILETRMTRLSEEGKLNIEGELLKPLIGCIIVESFDAVKAESDEKVLPMKAKKSKKE